MANAALVKKVAFPREILAISSVGAALVHFFLQSIVLVLALLIFRYPVSGRFLLLIPPALLVLLLLTTALGVLLAAVNVYLRDTQHLLELALLAWFWMTPIVYQYRMRMPPSGGKGRSIQPLPFVTHGAGTPGCAGVLGLTLLAEPLPRVCGVENVPWLSWTFLK